MSDLLALPAPSDPPPRGVTGFDPVPRRTRSGWTPDRQRAFIAALAGTGSVTLAAATVGLTREGAYLLRAAAGSEGFAAAWDIAVAEGIRALKAVAFDRAINGEPVPIFYQGQQVGERRKFNNALLLRLLAHYDPQSARQAALPSPFAAKPGFPQSSSPAVTARLASKLKPIAQMDAADFRRNQQWQDLLRFNRQLNELALVHQLRRWIAEGGLGAITFHLDYLERTARENPMITAEMQREIAATGTLTRPWLDTVSALNLLLIAETVEATVAAGVIP